MILGQAALPGPAGGADKDCHRKMCSAADFLISRGNFLARCSNPAQITE